MTDIPAAAKRATPQQRRRREKKDRRTCWTCGRTGHISRVCQASPLPDDRTPKGSSTARTFNAVVTRSPEIETLTVEGSVGDVRCNMLVDTGSAVILADGKFMRCSETLWDVIHTGDAKPVRCFPTRIAHH
ncbi:zinc knuckle protein [Trichinella spiralis]|nr:zinc knuckle protein [Trichinella spiralis]